MRSSTTRLKSGLANPLSMVSDRLESVHKGLGEMQTLGHRRR